MPQRELPEAIPKSQARRWGEEIANSITHGVGAGLSVVGLVVLVALAAWYHDVYRIVSFSIYGGTLIALYLASTVYHGLQNPRTKRVFRLVDHASIYLLIAGTYTPFLLASVHERSNWTLLAAVWLLAVAGAVFEVCFIDRFRVFSTAGYVALGWLCVFVGRQMLLGIPRGGLIWLIAGGLAYTLGVIFFAWHSLPYNHTIWHLFVLAGSICHYLAILLYYQAPVA